MSPKHYSTSLPGSAMLKAQWNRFL